MSKINKEKLYLEISEKLKQNLLDERERTNKSSVAQVVREILNGYFKRQRNKK